jgi:hypothetical protein
MLSHQFVHPRHQPLFLSGIFLGRVPLRAARLTKDLTRPTLRHVLLLLNVFHCVATPRRAQ